MIHHAFVISAFSESDSMLPQEITSSGRPIPIKLSVDSATIALRMFITTINIIDEKSSVPDGAIKYRKTASHTARRNHVFTVPDLPYFGPHNLCNACPACHSDHGRNRNHIGFSRSGQKKNDKKKIRHRQKISVSRIRSASSHAGAHPLTAPKRTAITVEISVESRPIASDILPPYQIIEKISLPIVSVPNRNSRHGMTEQFFRSIYEGSFVMICRQKRQISAQEDPESPAATGRS